MLDSLEMREARKSLLREELPAHFATAKEVWRREFPAKADRLITVVQPWFDPDLSLAPMEPTETDVEAMRRAITWRGFRRIERKTMILELDFLEKILPGGSVETLGWDLMELFQRDVASRLSEDDVTNLLATLKDTMNEPLMDVLRASFDARVSEYLPPVDCFQKTLISLCYVVHRNISKLLLFALAAELLDDPSVRLTVLEEQHRKGFFFLGRDRMSPTGYVLQSLPSRD